MAKARSNSSSNVQQVLSNKGDAIDEGIDNAVGEGADERPDATLTRDERIRLAAYALAERRGFQPGAETQDWLDAEREVDAASGEGHAADGAR